MTRQIGNALIASHRGRCAPKGKVGATFEHRSTRHTSRKHNATAQAVKGNFGGFCVSPHAQKTTPARVACRSRLCRNSRLGGMGASRPAEVLALGYWVGRESSLRPGAFARLACCGRPLPASRSSALVLAGSRLGGCHWVMQDMWECVKVIKPHKQGQKHQPDKGPALGNLFPILTRSPRL